ncbi:IPT/TIG domain-containing protein [Haliangium ochraceum]|uniref:Cell surface receptor IPT/TIG domain protein n=1 Tax=Haliangium ochraceum (strain DSM 14365 / JCM 11303 / SMP-2) TaxID=502025 RepID=D0LLR9_HALO1|nr:IPT/TIG domain-containing protein [Haliangium ochraceum]ACY13286.1 cell surface receptor IPT/TIG domain protein [Haliangium ochraceum DSM 14365]
MTAPTITAIELVSGPTAGGDMVRIVGTGFADALAVRFGSAPARVHGVRTEAALTVAEVFTPAHVAGAVDVTVTNLDAAGAPVPGEEATARDAYRFERPDLVHESELTRLVRTLLQTLKRDLLEATSLSVSVDYDDTTVDGASVIALAKLPAIVLSGPRVPENRFFSTNVAHEAPAPGPAGTELARRRPSLTVDLAFTLTAASDRTAELLNLMTAVATVLHRACWLEMPRDPQNPAQGTVRWEMDRAGEIRTRLDGPDDVRVFSCDFVIRGFDLDEGLVHTRSRAVDHVALATEARPPHSDPAPGAARKDSK